MKLHTNIPVLAMLVFSIVSCNSFGSEKRNTPDSGGMRTTSDTTIIPGTPGPSGTQPRPGDTTKAYRDSLKKLKNISDSSNR